MTSDLDPINHVHHAAVIYDLVVLQLNRVSHPLAAEVDGIMTLKILQVFYQLETLTRCAKAERERERERNCNRTTHQGRPLAAKLLPMPIILFWEV